MPTSKRLHGRQDAELVGLVFQLTDALQHRFESVAVQHGLTRQQATLLGLLEEPQPMSVLAERLRRVASNITGLVDRLERQGLVTRERSSEDRRVIVISATRDGRDLYARFEKALYSQDLPFAALDSEQRATLLSLLRPLV
ncbi:MarR family winged helix-turn-helix transcriptional regulator [Nocardioides rubriscoriae]|uniref:MarR family winged helix-turn-helix transcriptional regulator n=1 Tax=Nocardioides rubriscoriae TaxID=642762 RepID=UPI0011DF5578|nr:MarR family transcriptional regulator [Nocardioides rubriscoriae]